MGKNILITGGCGFIGSHYVNYLFDNTDFNIINIDCMYYVASENNVNDCVRKSNRYTFYNLNLCNYDSVLNILKEHNINFIIHFAAQSHVQTSFNNSINFINDNIIGTHSLLESIKLLNLTTKQIELFIYISTDEVYGESTDNIKKYETDLLQPTNPYAATKASCELLVQSYYKSFNIPIIITRGNNVYGKNQYPEKVISSFINNIKNNKKMQIQGNGSQLRSFIHVIDVCRAIDIIFKHGKIGEIYNIGSDNSEYTILETAQIIYNYYYLNINSEHFFKKFEDSIEYIDDRPFNDKRYHISNDKLKNLGWTQTIYGLLLTGMF